MPSTYSIFLFGLLCALIVAALLGGVGSSAMREGKKPGPRIAAVLAGTVLWLGAISLLVSSGWAERSPMPRLMVLFAAMNLVSLGIGLSPIGRWLAGNPIPLLVLFQGFRLPLELILHIWARDKFIPSTMTWTGSNFDIVTGILALVLAPFAARHRAIAWTFNVIGFALLINVARVAVLSSPLPFAWHVTPPLALLFRLPFALIVPIAIGGALIGHMALTRALLFRSGAQSSGSRV